MTNPAYSRHFVLKQLFAKLGDVVSLNLYKKKGSIQKIISFFLSKRTIKQSLKNIRFDIFDAIVLTTISYPAMKYLKKLCIKKKKILIFDCVEWASPQEKKLGRLSPSYIHNTRINEHLIDKQVRVISISTYLANYFKNKNIKTVVIPNLVDTRTLSPIIKQRHDKIELVFAGYPQKKDAINVAIEGILELSKAEQNLISLSLAGIDKETFYKKYKNLQKYSDIINRFVNFKGIVSSDVIKELYSQADFSILIRDNSLRVCKAGFPTKLLDSFKYSTPIIANSSSDIIKYLIDGKNGFVVNGFSPNEFAASLKSIINLYKSNALSIDEMSKNAFKTCIDEFNYLNYIETAKQLFD